MGTGLLRVLAARNRLLFNRYEDLLSLPVIARVAKVLLDLSLAGERPVNRIRYTNQQIAGLAATVPEAVSRSIKSLREMDMIASTRTRITILAPEKLTDMAFVQPLDFTSRY